MKKNLIVMLGMLFGVVTLNAQDDNPCWGETENDKTLCQEAYSIWQGDRKQGDMNTAYESWLRVRNICPPCVHEKVYSEGAKYYTAFLKANKEDEALKQLYIDSLLMIYSERMDLLPDFPSKITDPAKKKAKLASSLANLQGRYGITLFKYRPAEFEKAQEYLKPSVETLEEKSSPTTIQAYYSTIAEQFSAGVETKDTTVIKAKKIELLKTFVELDEYTEKAVSKLNEKGEEDKAKKYKTMRANLLKIFLQLEAKCESLEKLVMENLYQEGDPKSCKTALTILTIKECTEGESYPILAECSDDGSHESAFSIAIIFLKSSQNAKAMSWFDKAIERCDGCEQKESYLLRAGQTAIATGSPGKAKKYARQVLDINPSSGDAYLILADAWTKSDCGDPKFGKGCSFWIAYDYYVRAKNLNPDLASKANKSMAAIKSGWPSKREVNTQGLSVGGTYSCCSGISTKIRTRD